MSSYRLRCLLGLALALCLPSLADANPVKSRYTTIELKNCKNVQRHRDGGGWMCTGLPRFPVYVAEGDLRQYVSIGQNARKHRAANQTLVPFNSIFDARNRATIEWRFTQRNGQDEPYATIVSYDTKNDEGSGRVLVVTKVGKSESCHVAYIDAVANTNAIALARNVADKTTASFDCSREPEVVGASGKSPM